MPHYTRMTRYNVERVADGVAHVQANGDARLFDMLQRTVPGVRTAVDPHPDSPYTWGGLVTVPDDAAETHLHTTVHLMKETITVFTSLDACITLNVLNDPLTGNPTPAGLHAKTLKTDPSNAVGLEWLITALVAVVRSHPLYGDADLIVPVPSYTAKPFDLSTELALRVGAACGQRDGGYALVKARPTKPMRTIKDPYSVEKFTNQLAAFAVIDDHPFAGKTVIIIDDILHSGTTLQEVSYTLKQAGARRVLGLAVVLSLDEAG